MDQARKEKNTNMLEWYDAMVFAFVIVLLILMFIVRTVTVDGESMVPTLQNSDQLVARSIFYKPKNNDIVVIDGYINYGEPLVKRIIATGGDVVDIDFATGDVTVNGNVLDEPYISAPTTTQWDVDFPLVVPEGKVFLMGDNRPRSLDSRHSDIGFIDERDILGKVIFRILPFSSFGKVA